MQGKTAMKIMNKITEASNALNDNLNLLNEAKILELEAHIWDLKSTIFNQEQLIERNRKYHNGTLLQLGKAKHVIDLMKIMLIGAEKLNGNSAKQLLVAYHVKLNYYGKTNCNIL